MAFTTKQDLADRAEALVHHHVRDAISRTAIESVLDSTVLWLCRYSPRIVTDLTLDGDGTTTQFALSSLAVAWVNGFSTLRRVEHPTGENPRRFLDSSEFWLFPEPDQATHVEFRTAPDSGTNNIRLTYTAPHTVDGSSSTVPDHEEPAYEFALAAKVAEIEAGRTSRFTDSELDADAVDYGGASGRWLEVSRAWLRQAGQVLGVDLTASPGAQGTSAPALGWVDYDPTTRLGGHLLRSRRER